MPLTIPETPVPEDETEDFSSGAGGRVTLPETPLPSLVESPYGEEHEYVEEGEYVQQFTSEQLQQGLKYSAYAAASAACVLVPVLSFPGIFVGRRYIKKARLNGNPALLGVIAFWLNIIASVVQVLLLILALVAGSIWYQDMLNKQPARTATSTSIHAPPALP